MKCKHRNRHTMSAMRIVGATSAPIFHVKNLNGGLSRLAQVKMNRCLDCGHWLPLGPANDSDERVRVEKRAAFLAPEFVDAGEFTRVEWMGFNGDEEYVDGDTGRLMRMDLDREGWRAGYLANVIVEHSMHDTEEG